MIFLNTFLFLLATLAVVYRNGISHTASFELDPVIIGIVTSSGILLVCIIFAYVTIVNRRRFIRNIRMRKPILNFATTEVTSENYNNESTSHHSTYQ